MVLASRRPPAKKTGQSHVMLADISRKGDTDDLIARIEREVAPLRGIIHAAGILEEGLLGEQSRESFEAVLAGKAQGAWNLHVATAGHKLDFFILLSSIASVWGSPGQSAYAAANAFLDGLAGHRKAQGLAALSVNFGPWGQGGMADKRSRSLLARQGIRPMGTRRVLAALETLLGGGHTEGVVADVDWPLFQQVYQARRERRLFADLTTCQPAQAAGPGKLAQEVAAAPAGGRRKLLERRLREVVGSVLRLPASEIDLEKGFADLGMDSLMAVELRKRLEELLGSAATLSSTIGFDYPTVRELSGYLLEVLHPSATNTGETAIPDLSQLTSEDQLDALLDENLKALGASSNG